MIGIEDRKELFRVRVVEKKGGNGCVVLCQLPGGEEYVLQFFRLQIHTEEDDPNIIDISRPKAAMKKYGKMDKDGAILP